MYNTRKNPIYKSQPSVILKAKRENFMPQAEWKEDQYNRMLLVQLPGFKREEIRVQLDNAGKLFVKGSRVTADNKYIDVDQSFDVPKDVIADKIGGWFEDGCLSLIMPKSVITKAEAVVKGESIMNEATKEEKSKQEATKEDQPKQEEEKHEQGKYGKEKKDDITREEKTRSHEEDQKEKPKITEAVEEMKENYKEKVQAISSDVKREKGKMKGTMQKMKLKMNEICRDTPKDIKKKINKMRQGEDGWLNSKYAVGALEKINRNRNIIAAAVLAFSAGLYVSHKLKAKK